MHDSFTCILLLIYFMVSHTTFDSNHRGFTVQRCKQTDARHPVATSCCVSSDLTRDMWPMHVNFIWHMYAYKLHNTYPVTTKTEDKTKQKILKNVNLHLIFYIQVLHYIVISAIKYINKIIKLIYLWVSWPV